MPPSPRLQRPSENRPALACVLLVGPPGPNQHRAGHGRRRYPVDCQRALAAAKVTAVGECVPQGKHRYYSLEGSKVAAALESLAVIAAPRGIHLWCTLQTCCAPPALVTTTLRAHWASGCMTAAKALGWLSLRSRTGVVYDLSLTGAKAFAALGIDVESCRKQRRRFAYACLRME